MNLGLGYISKRRRRVVGSLSDTTSSISYNHLGLNVIIRWRGKGLRSSLEPYISQSLTFIDSGIDNSHISTVLNTPGNVAYFPLDTATAPNANLSSATPDLTYHGTVSTLQVGAGSHTGSSTAFGGTGYATLTDNVFDFSNNFTLSAFVKLGNAPRDGAYSVVASGSYVSGLTLVTDYALYSEGPGGTFQFAVTSTSGTVTVNSTTVPVAGVWYQVQVTYDGAFISIYVNGILENQVAQSADLAAITGRTFSVGALGDGSQLFPGSIDDVAAYNAALNATQLNLILSTAGDAKARITANALEIASDRVPLARVSANALEVASDRVPKARITTNVLEVASTRTAKARITTNVIEVLFSLQSPLIQLSSHTLSFIQLASLNSIHNLDLSQSLILTQHLSSPTYKISQSITFTQAATSFIVHTSSQALTFTQTAKAEQDHVYQTLLFTSSISLISEHNLSVPTFLDFKQSIHFPPYTSTQHLTFVSTATQYILRNIHQTLLFSQNIDVDAIRPVDQTLTFTSIATQNTIRSLSINQDLIFIEGYNKQLPIRIFPPSIPIPSLPIPITQIPNITTIFINNPIQVQQPNTRIFIPSASFIVAPKTCIFILGVKDDSVVLPCPLFGDSWGFTSTTTIKRTMTGSYFTYNKINQLQKFSYTFNIFKSKMYEIRNFMIKYMSSVIFVQNHKSELWLAYVTNNPISFVSKSRWGSSCPEEGNEKVEFVLELQGARLL